MAAKCGKLFFNENFVIIVTFTDRLQKYIFFESWGNPVSANKQ